HGLYAGAALGATAAYVWWSAHPAEVSAAARALPMSRYYFAVAELAFSAACFEIWLRLWRRGTRRAVVGRFFAVAAITNTIYHFPTLFAILSVLSTRPDEASGAVRFLTYLGDPEVLARVAHFSAASLAVAGVLLAALAASIGPAAAERTDGKPSASEIALGLKTRGAMIALITTVLQWPIGIIVLLQLPEISREALMGNSAGATMLFVISLVAVVMLMHRLAAAAFGETTFAEIRSLLLWLGITIVLMTAVRHYAREPLYLSDSVVRSLSTHTGDFAHGNRRS
ncbi:MAG: hypothetical protein K8U03_22590, partial [Planctomycetia bacterium]|nr:hypothetical protein [Planctomycetia bacterium]